MKDYLSDISQKSAARVAGVNYLVVIILGIFANMIVRMTFFVPDDPTATVENITDNEFLFRLSFVCDLIMSMCWLFVGVALYLVYKEVNKNISLLMVLSFLAGVPIMMLNLIFHYGALLLLSDEYYSTIFTSDQLNALVMLFLNLHEQGYIIATLFTSFCLLPFGYLSLKSGYFPTVLSTLLIIGPTLAIIDHFMVLLFQTPFELTMLMTIPLVIAEFSTCGWLLLKGVKIPE
ncbi:MAG: DUF4386 domain-containing protein [Candidatus Hodarchaeota archaeon]